MKHNWLWTHNSPELKVPGNITLIEWDRVFPIISRLLVIRRSAVANASGVLGYRYDPWRPKRVLRLAHAPTHFTQRERGLESVN